MDEDRVPNRQLTPQERDELYVPLMAEVGVRLLNLAAGDADLLWALRRKLAKELTYLERSKPAQRKALKKKKVRAQDGICPECRMQLPNQIMFSIEFKRWAVTHLKTRGCSADPAISKLRVAAATRESRFNVARGLLSRPAGRNSEQAATAPAARHRFAAEAFLGQRPAE